VVFALDAAVAVPMDGTAVWVAPAADGAGVVGQFEF